MNEKSESVQTILGSGGAIGTELSKALTNYTSDIRLVSRNPKKVNETDQLFPADLLDRKQVLKAVEGSEVCYLTAGLKYSTKVWQDQWPVLIKNVTEACIRHRSRLVFFSNVYAIGGDNVKHITEESPVSPVSKKGKIRASVENHIADQVEKGALKAIIARSPDFFSSMIDQSVLMNMVYKNLAAGKKARWFCNADMIHTFGYTHDLARGTAILGNTTDAFDRIWNLPTDLQALTGRQWVELFASEMNEKNRLMVMPGWAVKSLGLFIPILDELHEMLYQFDRDYYFDSAKFTSRFNFIPATNRDGVRQTINALR